MRRPFVLIAIVAALLAAAAHADTALTTRKIASGLARPVYVTAPPGDNSRIFIVEQRSGTIGRIRVFDFATNSLLATPFLSVSGLATGNEQGLLGLAFHPDYANNGYFYVNYTRSSDARTIVRRYTNPTPSSNVADPNSAYEIINIAQPFSNHNGGWIAFGPDDYLYIGMGDGGSANDPGNRAQNLNELLGKMLRIDVDGDDFTTDPNSNYAIPAGNPFAGATAGRDEIWHYGLRNPWRNAFDRETGDLYIADVGQNAWEEVSVQPAGMGGLNFGWRCMEGNACTGLSGCSCNAPTLTDPIHVYSHGAGCSISGGYVYRGGICDLRGTYFFADYCSNTIWSLRYDGSTVSELTNRSTELDPPGADTITSITSFGEDNRGEIYICEQGGDIWKIVPVGPGKGDANNDGVVNFGDIDPFVLALADPAGYATLYGFPAEQANDFNCDGVVNFSDIDPFVAALAN